MCTRSCGVNRTDSAPTRKISVIIYEKFSKSKNLSQKIKKYWAPCRAQYLLLRNYACAFATVGVQYVYRLAHGKYNVIALGQCD